MFTYYLKDIIYGDGFRFIVNNAVHDMLSQIHIYFLIENSRTCHDSNNDTFQVTYAFIHIFGNIIDYLLWKLESIAVYFIAQNIFAKFYGRFFQFSYHTPFETGKQTFFNTLQQYRSTVGS